MRFEAQRVARAQAAGQHSEFLARLQHLVPDSRAGGLVGRNVDFESIFAGVAGACDEGIPQSADRAARHPVELHRDEVGVGQLLQHIHALRALNRDLGEVVREILDFAVELSGYCRAPS